MARLNNRTRQMYVCLDVLNMKRQHTIRPDFVVANQREVNEDPGSRNTLGAITEINALRFIANSNSRVNMSTVDTDFRFTDGSHDIGFTFSFWVNTDAIGATQYLFGFYGGEYYCQLTSSGRLYMSLRDASVGFNQFGSLQVDGNHIFAGEATKWVHIAIAYTPDPDNSDSNHTEQVQFYKNGSPWGSPIVSPADTYVTMEAHGASKFTLGNLSSGGTTIGLRTLSNFVVYRHDGQSGRSHLCLVTLTCLRFTTGRPLSNHSKGPKQADIVGYWKLDEDVSTATQITDYSGLSNHLNTIGSAVTTDTSSGLHINTKKTLAWSQRRATVPGVLSLRTNP